jgi:hypothetical protein
MDTTLIIALLVAAIIIVVAIIIAIIYIRKRAAQTSVVAPTSTAVFVDPNTADGIAKIKAFIAGARSKMAVVTYADDYRALYFGSRFICKLLLVIIDSSNLFIAVNASRGSPIAAESMVVAIVPSGGMYVYSLSLDDGLVAYDSVGVLHAAASPMPANTRFRAESIFVPNTGVNSALLATLKTMHETSYGSSLTLGNLSVERLLGDASNVRAQMINPAAKPSANVFIYMFSRMTNETIVRNARVTPTSYANVFTFFDGQTNGAFMIMDNRNVIMFDTATLRLSIGSGTSFPRLKTIPRFLYMNIAIATGQEPGASTMAGESFANPEEIAAESARSAFPSRHHAHA